MAYSVNVETQGRISFTLIFNFVRTFHQEHSNKTHFVYTLDNLITSAFFINVKGEKGSYIVLRITSDAGYTFEKKYTPQPELYKEKLDGFNIVEQPMKVRSGAVDRPPAELAHYYMPDINFAIAKPPAAVRYLVDVYYATDRNQNVADDKITYGNKRGQVRYGVCQVNIPKKKRVGHIPTPEWWRLEFKENVEKHVVVITTVELSGNDFFQTVRGKVRDSEKNDAFIFIHGYNVSFQQAIRRAAQMAFDIGFTGAPIVYSWPSKATVKGYFSDEDNVQYSQDTIIQFIKDVRSKTNAAKIHLIAHSMGNRALVNALIKLKEENFHDQFLFNNIILAAPDIDAELFIKNIAPKIIDCSKRITLYASSKDNALAASRHLRGDIIRAGESGDEIVCVDGIDTIDASDVDTTLLGHGYFADTAAVLHDLHMLIKLELSPQDRNLLKQIANSKYFWRFKPQ